jgi:hypothetical protein
LLVSDGWFLEWLGEKRGVVVVRLGLCGG